MKKLMIVGSALALGLSACTSLDSESCCSATASCGTQAIPASYKDIKMPLPAGTKILDVGPKANLKTLEDALDHVAEIRKTDVKTPLALRVAPGDYAPAKPLNINTAHAWTNTAPLIIYAADFSSRPRIHGGVPIRGWKKTTFNGRKDVWVADVSKMTLTKNPKEAPRPRMLFFNGTRQQPARWPNFDKKKPYSTGYAYAKELENKEYYADEVVMADKDVRTWAHPEDGWSWLNPEHNYWTRFHDLSAQTNATVYLKGARHSKLGGYNRYDRWCAENIAEELDLPGEWYFNPREKKVYLISPDGTDPNKTVVAFPQKEPIFSVRKAGNLTIAGLELTGGHDGIRIYGSDGVDIIACSVHDVGWNGFGDMHAGVGIFTMGKKTRVFDCDVYNIGNHGIQEHGNYGVISNNYIHHCGQIDPAGQAVRNSGSFNIVTHNLMHDFPRSAICGYGRFSETSYNRIRHTNQTGDDTGALYDAAWTSCVGSKICYNWISDSIGYKRQEDGTYWFNEGATGIYFDECSGGAEVYGNLIENCSMAGMHCHNARWITISNNVFVSNGKRNPSSRWTMQLSLQTWDKSSFSKGRINYYGGEHNKFVERFPQYANHPALRQNPKTDEVFSNDKYGTMMMGMKVEKNIFYFPDQSAWVFYHAPGLNPATNTVNHNVIWPGIAWAGATNVMHVRHSRCVEMQKMKREDRPKDWDPFAIDGWDTWKKVGFDKDSIIADPLFANPNMKDFRLRPDSPAFKMGFKELPYEKMGLQRSYFRPQLPEKEAEGLREHPEWLELNYRWQK